MNRQQLGILEEFGDDVSYLCDAILDLRLEVEKLTEENENLKSELEDAKD